MQTFWIRTVVEALGTLLLIYMLIHEADLIVFEQDTARKFRETVNRMKYRIYWSVQDVKAIRRACKRQGITFRGFVILIWQERKGIKENESVQRF